MAVTKTRQDGIINPPEEILLEVDGLSAGFDVEGRFLEAVDGLSFKLKRGQTLGIVGESGCGKSVSAMSIMRLLPRPSGRVTAGRVVYRGRDLLELNDRDMRAMRGEEISMIFQEPMSALNPLHTVGRQVMENLLLHRAGMAKHEAMEKALEMLRLVGIPAPEDRFIEFPHQLSGGMRQRVMIAMALICSPKVLLADEPTTALDVTTQAQILDLIARLQKEYGLSVVLISHDLGVIAEVCSEVLVMYAGRVVEMGPTREILKAPLHRYTRGLLDSIPDMNSTPKSLLKTIPGRVPSLAEMPVGARFAPRSDHPGVQEYLSSRDYQTKRPPLIEALPGHWVEDCEYVLL